MSSYGTPLLGRPTTGEEENKAQTAKPTRQTKLSEHTDLDTDLNLPWGDSIDEKPNNATRIFQNINGISTANDFVSASEIGFRADADQVDILCLAETNLDWGFNQHRRSCESHWRPFWKVMKLVTASSTITYNTSYQPGGVATVVGGNWVGPLSDYEAVSHGFGRWTTCTLRGKSNTKLTIITAYQVCKDNIAQSGPNRRIDNNGHC
jgi:hypothetical protein